MFIFFILELSEKAKADLKEFEEQEERKRQNRYGRGRGARGGRGRGGILGYVPQDMRGNRRRMSDQRYPFIGNMNMNMNMQVNTHFKHKSCLAFVFIVYREIVQFFLLSISLFLPN